MPTSSPTKYLSENPAEAAPTPPVTGVGARAASFRTDSKPRVFVDADVLFAGAAGPSEQGASLVVLRLAEITLIEALASEQVVTEAERNLALKLPTTLPAFRLLVSRCLRVVPDPSPDELAAYAGLANPEDLPILVTALREQCPWLVTFNIRHHAPGHARVTVLRPGDFISNIRGLLTQLVRERTDPSGF